jgi:hypothetical protein
VGSLAGPGYGVGFDPDLETMVPLERWTFDSLGDSLGVAAAGPA